MDHDDLVDAASMSSWSMYWVTMPKFWRAVRLVGEWMIRMANKHQKYVPM